MMGSDETIGLVVHVFNSSQVSGCESLVLPALAHAGFRVVVVFLVEERRGERGRKASAYAESLGIPVEDVRVKGRVDPAAAKALARVLDRLRPAIVHAHDVKASAYAWAASRLVAARSFSLYSTHHGIHGRPDWKSKFYESFYARAILPTYDHVLAVSTADRRELVSRGLADARVHLHLNGADASRTAPADRALAARAIRAAWGLRDDGALVLGVVARLSQEKRHDRILDVLAELVRLSPGRSWRLVCFGQGPLEAGLRARVTALGLDGRVLFAGYRPRVGEEMAGFDVLLSLSDAEGLPINLIEAGWAATPVVATNVGGVADLLGDPPAGLLLDVQATPQEMARDLDRLLVDEEGRRQLGLRLQERVAAGFSQAAWLDRLAELYRLSRLSGPTSRPEPKPSGGRLARGAS